MEFFRCSDIGRGEQGGIAKISPPVKKILGNTPLSGEAELPHRRAKYIIIQKIYPLYTPYEKFSKYPPISPRVDIPCTCLDIG